VSDASERHTIRGWARRISGDDELLTLEEAQVLAAIATNDRLVEVRDALQDVQARLTRLELFMGVAIPGYDEQVRARLAGPNGTAGSMR
jgi:hypothetical protein